MIVFEPSPMAGIPLISRPRAARVDLIEVVSRHLEIILERLCESGALLFRGYGISNPALFDAFATSLTLPRLDYLYRSTPRTSVADRIFTATEYPADVEISLHNENAFQKTWPLKLAFCCVTAPQCGGETPIADMRAVTADMPLALMGKLAECGVTYRRVYRPNLDLPWTTVFQTHDKRVVGAYCTENNIAFEWIADDGLRTEQTCQGVARHPLTGETVFFNQAHMFHPSNLGPEAEILLRESFADRDLPRNATFGDGSEFDAEDLAAVRAAYSRHATAFSWQEGDVLLLDNMRCAHGRRPYAGARKILAILMDAVGAAAPRGESPA